MKRCSILKSEYCKRNQWDDISYSLGWRKVWSLAGGKWELVLCWQYKRSSISSLALDIGLTGLCLWISFLFLQPPSLGLSSRLKALNTHLKILSPFQDSILITNCLLDISTWISNRHPKFNMSKDELTHDLPIPVSSFIKFLPQTSHLRKGNPSCSSPKLGNRFWFLSFTSHIQGSLSSVC